MEHVQIFSSYTRLTIGLILWYCLSLSTLNAQQTINVPADYATIQEALDAAEENATINVSAGTYFEHLEWPNVEGIKLLGVDGRENTIIDGNGQDRVIEILDALNSTTLIDGFTIQNGIHDIEINGNLGGGGGILSRFSNVSLRNLIIQNNRGEGSSAHGAGAHLGNYAGKIENCIFRNNTITTEARSWGPALYIEVVAYAEVINCDFDNNAGSTDTHGSGGAMYIAATADNDEVEIKNCSFTNNSMTSELNTNGGAIYVEDLSLLTGIDGEFTISIDSCSFLNNQTISNSTFRGSNGGAIYSEATILNISNSILNENTSDQGSAIYHDNSGLNVYPEINLSSNTFSKNKSESTDENATVFFSNKGTIENNIISHNSTTYSIEHDNGSSSGASNIITIINSTLAYNQGPIFLDSNSELISTNSIYWNLSTAEIEVNQSSSSVELKNCLVRNGYAGDDIIDSDPRFVNEDILIPTSNSPCLGAGTLDNFSNTDINGIDRPAPVNSNPDIGAYEVNQSTAIASIKFFYDLDQNGIQDSGEEYIALGAINLNDQIFNNFSENGMLLRLDQGSNTLSFNDLASNTWFTTSQEEYQVEVDTEDFFQEIEFGLYPNSLRSIVYDFIEGDPFRCGEEIRMSVNAKNLGTTVESGILWLIIDGRLDDFSFEIAPDVSNSSNEVGWEFDNLQPFETFTRNFRVTAPLIESAEELGEMYFFKSDLQSTLTADIICYNAELRCSYDPNDKLVSPNREDQLALLDEHLFYTIRFQNTGNDYARDVVVRDTLDPNLDIRTFSLAGSSHPELLEVIIEENNIIAFEFKDIFLLDSLTNFEASNGHISYLIKPLEGLPEETVIQNTAHIYFDFNPAIVTNTTNNILVEEFPTVSNDNVIISPIQLFPNPTGQILNFSKHIDGGKIYNTNGALITNFGSSQNIDVSSLNDGIYFIEMELNGEIWKEKFTVLK